MSAVPIPFPETTAQVWTLPNGLEIIVKEDHGAPVTSLQAWCRAGSIHEAEWLGGGLSHLLEHMLFKGTSDLDAGQIAETVQDQGGYINAYTSFDRTVYWIDSPTTGYERCLELLCSVVSDSQLPAHELDREQEVIRREFAMGDDNPDQVISKMMFATAFPDAPYGHPVIGYLDIFDKLTREDLVTYYQRHYVPNNLFFVVAGDVDAARVRKIIEEKLGAWPRKARTPLYLPRPGRQLGSRERHEEFETDLSRSRLAWHVPGLTHKDMPALDTLAIILGEGRSSRLFQRVREEKRLAHSVAAYAYTPSQTGLFIISLNTDPDKRDEAQAEALACVEEIKQHGVTAAELAKAVRMVLSGQFETLATMRGQASDLGSNWHLARNLNFTRDFVNMAQSVTAEDVQAVANRYLRDSARTTVSLNPRKTGPAGPAIITAPAPADIRKVVLENGLTVLLREDRRLPTISVSSVFRGGLLAEDPATNGLSKLLARLLTKDTLIRSSADVADLMESVGGYIAASSGNNSFGVSAGFMAPELELGLDVLGDALLRPAFKEETLNAERDHQIAAIKAEGDQPVRQAMKRMRDELFPGHPYALNPLGTAASVNSLGVDHLRAMESRLLTGGNGVIAVFGDIDSGRTEEMVRARFGGLRAGERQFEDETGSDENLPPLESKIITERHDKSQAILIVGYRCCGIRHEDYQALSLLDEACSDMASRFFLKIREQMGLAYSVGATRLVGLDTGAFLFYCATDPKKLEDVQIVLQAEIDDLAAKGLKEDEFKRAQNSLLGKEAVHVQSSRELSGVAAIDELLGLGWDDYLKDPERIRALNLDRMHSVCGAYFENRPAITVQLTPEEG